MRASAVVAVVAGLLLFAPNAEARTWTDPGMKRAVEAAELIVRVQAPAAGSSKLARVRFRVLETLKGRALSAVTVGNLHDPARCSGPVFQPDEQLYLLLTRDRRGRFVVPTPTFGRFPIRNGVVRYAALRGTHLRLDLPTPDFAAYLRLLLGKVDAGWLAGLRKHLDETPHTAGRAEVSRAYLALEALAVAGSPEDLPRTRRFLVADAPYQLRISALRALTRSGSRAGAALLRAAEHDPEPAVRTAAFRCLAKVASAADVPRLLQLLPKASQDPVHFTGPTDPRLNAWPAPRVALLEVIAKLGRAGVAQAQPTLLKLIDDPATSIQALGAALEALTRVGARVAPHLVARLDRHRDLRGRLTTAALCATLQKVTGRPLGVDVEAWRLWARTRAKRR